MRLEQDLRDNLQAAAAALAVPEPSNAPQPKTTPGWRRPLAFAAAGAVAALALVVVPTLIIGPPSPSGTTLTPLGATSVDPSTTGTRPASTTTVVDPDRVVMADEPSGDYRLLLVADRDPTEVDPPVATVRLSVLDGGDEASEVVVGEKGSFFWHSVSAPGGLCQFSTTSIDGGVRVAAQILLSPSLGCSEPYLFDLDPADASLSPVDLTAEDVAQLFVKAWLSGSEGAMESLAGPNALAQADAIDIGVPSGAAVCEGTAGSLYCTWEAAEGRLVVRVSTADVPPRVEEVRLEPGA
ncbi:MAG: hypothetical protein ACRDZM_10675 [Acidimicrobiia bacterium]